MDDDNLPTTAQQTRPRATSKPAEEEHDDEDGGQPDPFGAAAHENHEDTRSDCASTASSKRSFGEDDDINDDDGADFSRSFKKKRLAHQQITEDDEVYAKGTAGADTVQFTEENAEEGFITDVTHDADTHEPSLSLDEGEEEDDDDFVCFHDSFDKHDGVSSHGLWPHGAMICECGSKIIGVRGTAMPCVGRGHFGSH